MVQAFAGVGFRDVLVVFGFMWGEVSGFRSRLDLELVEYNYLDRNACRLIIVFDYLRLSVWCGSEFIPMLQVLLFLCWTRSRIHSSGWVFRGVLGGQLPSFCLACVCVFFPSAYSLQRYADLVVGEVIGLAVGCLFSHLGLAVLFLLLFLSPSFVLVVVWLYSFGCFLALGCS